VIIRGNAEDYLHRLFLLSDHLYKREHVQALTRDCGIRFGGWCDVLWLVAHGSAPTWLSRKTISRQIPAHYALYISREERPSLIGEKSPHPASSRQREDGRKNSLMPSGYNWHFRDPSTCSHPGLPGFKRRSGRQGKGSNSGFGTPTYDSSVKNRGLSLEINATLRPSTPSPSSTVPRRSARLKRSAGFQTSGSRAHSLPVVLPDRPG
jgi:hypothetical protein